MVGPDLSGAVLDGRYRLTSLLGAGGLGQVYEALEEASDEVLDVYVNQIYAIRRELDDRVRVSTSAVIFTSEDDAAVKAYNAAMRGWFEACEATVAQEGSGET